MTAAVVALVACYVVLAVLLLSLNLRSSWRWQVKGAAIVVTAAFFVVAFLAVEAMLGWPTESPLPARFQLHAAVVREPDRQGDDRGSIYLWLSPRDVGGVVVGPPRAHALPYSRELHEQVARAKADLDRGRPIEGRAERRATRTGSDRNSVQVELFEAPPATLPPKTSRAPLRQPQAVVSSSSPSAAT